MAEQIQVRRIVLGDGTTCEYDGKTLDIGGSIITLKDQDDALALVWLLTGYKPRRGQAAKGGAKRQSAPKVTEPPTTVPAG